MLKEPHLRRPLAILLVIAGALAMFLAAETWAGALLLALGFAIELIGIALKRRS